MLDCRLIQNVDGDVWYFGGDAPPEGWIWMPPTIAPGVQVMGTWRVDAGQPAEIQERAICVGGDRIKCQIFSRVVGFITPLDSWHLGKKQEYKERVPYKVNYEALA